MSRKNVGFLLSEETIMLLKKYRTILKNNRSPGEKVPSLSDLADGILYNSAKESLKNLGDSNEISYNETG